MWRSSVQFVHGVGVAAYYNGGGYDTFVNGLYAQLCALPDVVKGMCSSFARRHGPIGVFNCACWWS